MSITLQVPSPLRRFTDGQSDLELQAANVGQALHGLVERYPDLERHLYKDGQLRSFINVFLNDEDVRFLQRQETPVADGDVLTIIPSIAGGKEA